MAYLDDKLNNLNKKCEENNQNATQTNEQVDELKHQAINAQAQIDYIAMMTDVEM